MKTSRPGNDHGLNLIELMITIAIMTVIGGMLAYFLAIGGVSWHTGDAEIQANQEARKGMMSMARELRQAQESTIKTMAGALYNKNIVYNDITFITISDIDGDGDTISAGGTLEWSAPISYYVAGNQLLRQSGGAIKVLANNVTGLQFMMFVVPDPDDPTKDAYRILIIALQTQKTSIEGRQVRSNLESSVKIRN